MRTELIDRMVTGMVRAQDFSEYKAQGDQPICQLTRRINVLSSIRRISVYSLDLGNSLAGRCLLPTYPTSHVDTIWESTDATRRTLRIFLMLTRITHLGWLSGRIMVIGMWRKGDHTRDDCGTDSLSPPARRIEHRAHELSPTWSI
jgi:hypothetical protein